MLFLLLAGACSEEEIGLYSGDTVYISFVRNSTQDSAVYSFKTYPGGEIVAEIPVKINGACLTEARGFTVSATDSTTLPATAYELPATCEFAPGQETDTIRVKFFNNFEELDKTAFRLFLKIDNSGNVKQGDPDYQLAKFYVSNKLEQPVWWTRNDGTVDKPTNIVEKIYLGEYSETKYIMFLEELEKGGASFDGTDMNVMKKYAIRLKYTLEAYEKEHGEKKKDEKGHIITVPVAG